MLHTKEIIIWNGGKWWVERCHLSSNRKSFDKEEDGGDVAGGISDESHQSFVGSVTAYHSTITNLIKHMIQAISKFKVNHEIESD